MPRTRAGWIDITQIITPGMRVYPGDPKPRIVTARGSDGIAVTQVTITTHIGTHCDLPPHVDEEFESVSEARILHALHGRVVVIRVRGSAADSAITLDALKRALRGRPPRRLLIRSDPSRPGHGCLAPEAARWLAGRTILVGTDELSIDPPGEDLTVHRILLGSGTLILENLLLAKVPAGPYHLIALPMRLGAPDGAPVRALIRPI
jgi:arylformamidase